MRKVSILITAILIFVFGSIVLAKNTTTTTDDKIKITGTVEEARNTTPSGVMGAETFEYTVIKDNGTYVKVFATAIVVPDPPAKVDTTINAGDRVEVYGTRLEVDSTTFRYAIKVKEQGDYIKKISEQDLEKAKIIGKVLKAENTTPSGICGAVNYEYKLIKDNGTIVKVFATEIVVPNPPAEVDTTIKKGDRVVAYGTKFETNDEKKIILEVKEQGDYIKKLEQTDKVKITGKVKSVENTTPPQTFGAVRYEYKVITDRGDTIKVKATEMVVLHPPVDLDLSIKKGDRVEVYGTKIIVNHFTKKYIIEVKEAGDYIEKIDKKHTKK